MGIRLGQPGRRDHGARPKILGGVTDRDSMLQAAGYLSLALCRKSSLRRNHCWPYRHENKANTRSRLQVSVFVEILARDVIGEHFVGKHLVFVGIVGRFDALYDSGFERVAFLNQFVHAFRRYSNPSG